MQALSPQLHPPWPSPGPTVLCRWANIDFLSLSWPVELRAKHRLLSPSSGRQDRLSTHCRPGAAGISHGSKKQSGGLESDVHPLKAFVFSPTHPHPCPVSKPTWVYSHVQAALWPPFSMSGLRGVEWGGWCMPTELWPHTEELCASSVFLYFF